MNFSMMLLIRSWWWRTLFVPAFPLVVRYAQLAKPEHFFWLQDDRYGCPWFLSPFIKERCQYNATVFEKSLAPPPYSLPVLMPGAFTGNIFDYPGCIPPSPQVEENSIYASRRQAFPESGQHCSCPEFISFLYQITYAINDNSRIVRT